MPRKSKGKGGDNVIAFPAGKEPKDITPDDTPDVVQKAQKGAEVVLRKLDENRKHGLTILERKVDAFNGRETIGDERPVNENDMRVLEQGIAAALTTLESLNSLMDILRHDLIGTIQNLEGQAVAGWQTSSHLQTLLATLKDKGVVTDEEMRDMWNKLIPPQLQGVKPDSEK